MSTIKHLNFIPIYTLFSGRGWYPRLFKEQIAFSLSVFYFIHFRCSFSFIGDYLFYCQCFGFKRDKQEMLQDFHLSYISFLSDPLICRLAAFIPCVRICSSQYCSIHLRFWLKIHTSFSLHPFAVSSLQKFHIPLAKNYHAEVYPFSREVTFKPLSSSLQRGGREEFAFSAIPYPHIIQPSLR